MSQPYNEDELRGPYDPARAEIEKLTKERDEARRVARQLAKPPACGCHRDGCEDCAKHAGVRATALDYPEAKS